MSKNIEILKGNILKLIFSFLTIEDLARNIRRVNKLMNKYSIEYKNELHKLKASYLPLFSTNVDFTNLKKFEILIENYPAISPININSQSLNKIKLIIRAQFQIKKCLEFWIESNLIKRLKSIKIILDSSTELHL